jgi:hypothetical protein
MLIVYTLLMQKTYPIFFLQEIDDTKTTYCNETYRSVKTIYQQTNYSDNVLVHSAAPTCFDSRTSL